MMELSRKEVPLYGHARVYFLLSSVKHPEDVFVVLEGSTLHHILQTKLHRLLYFITPGHNKQETVCVRAYTHVSGVLRCVGMAFLTFVEDDAQELAEYLVTHSNCLSHTKYSILIGRYGLTDSSRRVQMDHRVALALTNTHTPHSLLGQPGQESLLHLCVRLGFVCVCEFLLCQPGALMMVNSANHNGDTPLKLALRTNQHKLINLLTYPPNPLTTPLGGVSQVWTGDSGLLRFSHAFGTMSLSVCVSECMSSQHLHQAILLLKECVTNYPLTHMIKELFAGDESKEEKDFSSVLSDEPPSRVLPHVEVPYSEFSTSSDDDDDNDAAAAADDDEELLLDRNSAKLTASLTGECGTGLDSLCSPTVAGDNRTDQIPQKQELHSRALLTHNATGSSVIKLIADCSSGGWKNSQQLKAINNCPILLCSSSHSSPALFVSKHSNTETHRRRSNSDGCGHDVPGRKSCSVTGEFTSCSVIHSSAAAPLDYTAESWSTLVDTEFLNMLDRGTIKRQEVIYELMQTELHHVQMLTVMADVLRRGLQEEVQLEEDVIGQIFPSLDDLINLHRNFFTAMELRRRSSITRENSKNYMIQRIGDVLLQQFSGHVGDQVMELYGDFCSKHSDALRLYKELQQNNRKLQLFLRQQSSNSVIKRREIPEFLLLITQRITKYPVLLERLLQHTDGGTGEQHDITAALDSLRSVLVGVELCVCKVQRAQKLDNIIRRLDPKSCTRLKNGEIYSKHTFTHTTHTLTHSATLTCRTTSGRLRDVLAVLLTDVLVFLQEKEQKLTFAALEQKPAVVPLKGLIWREIANQERGLFLISSDTSAGPEMYEIHTHTREERNTWITLLHQTTHSLPDSDVKIKEEQKLKNIQKLQEALYSLDLQVCAALDEKLCVCVCAVEQSVGSPQLLVQPHLYTLHSHTHTPQGYTLLQEALREVDELSMLSLWKCPVKQMDAAMVETVLPTYVHLQVVEKVRSLARILYSLQAVVIIQDTLIEVQKLLLQEDEALPPWSFTDSEERPMEEWMKEVEEREREQAEEMEKMRKEEVELVGELKELEECVQALRNEQMRVEKERKRMEKERDFRETADSA